MINWQPFTRDLSVIIRYWEFTFWHLPSYWLTSQGLESDETNRSGVKMSNGPSQRTSTKCLYWIAPRPQYSLAQTAELNKTGGAGAKNLSQISDIPISEAVRLSHETPRTHPTQPPAPHPVLWCINRSSKEKRRVTENTMISTTVLDVSASGREAFLFPFFFSTTSQVETCWQGLKVGIDVAKASAQCSPLSF